MIQIITSGDSGMHNMDPSLKKKKIIIIKTKATVTAPQQIPFKTNMTKTIPKFLRLYTLAA